MHNFLHHILHIVSAVIAAVLFVISAFSYTRTKKSKFLFICAAFLLFSVKEILMAINVIYLHSPPLEIITHVLNFIILLLFAAGLLK